MLKIHKISILIIVIMILIYVHIIINQIPQKPQITYGEFPFFIEYEINGEKKTISDVVICEYDGINFGSNGAYRMWKKKLLRRDTADVLLVSENNKKIFCTVGEANYYMGDYDDEMKYVPVLYIEEFDSILDMKTHKSYIESEEKHKIKLISWKFSKPISNSFR